MKLDRERARTYLKGFDFSGLFTQCLGWDSDSANVQVQVDGQDYRLQMLADKRGVKALVCEIPTGAQFPDYAIRCKIDNRVTRYAREHLIIYHDSGKTLQVWQWVRRSAGMPVVRREQHLHTGQSGEALVQRLEAMVFTLEEEEWLTTVGVLERLAESNLYADKVSKKFYDRFRDEHARFLKFLGGVPEEHLRRWYASVMLNRLMFIYFIQKKGFLAGDVDYLKNKLAESKRRGKDQFYSELLCPLFFEGFAKKEEDRSQKTRSLLGRVPYLNGGIFEKHQIEKQHGRTIEVPDKAFDALFAFFDEYNWHLDERPLTAGDEINPDVLGYIFEKYINQKQMGAYYTKEDITEYIGRNTIVPRLLDLARKECKAAFEGEQSVWRYLVENPDRYIFEPVRRGVINADGSVLPESKLPGFVQDGMRDPKKRMCEKRYNLGDAELSDEKGNRLTLPSETWREYVARRQRCLGLRQKLAKGEVKDVNDLIVLNLDIRRFAQDVIENSEGRDLLKAFWQAIEGLSVLDPTCGSGAFLFAALNVICPLYQACLTRMQAFVTDLEQSGVKHSPKKYDDFRMALEQAAKHPSERYFILKSIVVNNLFGVDIMDEAVEICKLRLFLKLVAQVEPDTAKSNLGVEPLPDIDFNIRAGNTLVGYATYDQVKRAFSGGKRDDGSATSGRLDFEDAMGAIEGRAREVERLTTLFRRQQTEYGGAVTTQDKDVLRQRLRALEHELNIHLAREYGRVQQKPADLSLWREAHKPFHWFIEFYGIMKSGGFDVILGNPPFVEYSEVRDEYSILGFSTTQCGNLYAYVMERSYDIIAEHGRFAMIAPLASFSTSRMAPLRQLYVTNSSILCLSSYEATSNPTILFVGVKIQLSILVSQKQQNRKARQLTTSYLRSFAEERNTLFPRIAYCSPFEHSGRNARVQVPLELALLAKLYAKPGRVAGHIADSGRPNLYYRNMGNFFFKLAFPSEPPFFRNGRKEESSTVGGLRLLPDLDPRIAVAVVNSTLFYYYWVLFTDCYHLSRQDIADFPLSGHGMKDSVRAELVKLGEDYAHSLDACAVWRHERKKDGTEKKYKRYFPQQCKMLSDRIDRTLAKHYGFTDEELDFIINYDIKYRMGRNAGDRENEGDDGR